MKIFEIALCLILPLFLIMPAISQSGNMQSKGMMRILDPDKNDYQTIRGYENSYAVCIGIDEYVHWPMLSCAVSDAVAMQKKLIELGFDEVKLITNEEATKQDILSALSWLSKTADENDRAVIYFSGHGETREGRGGENLGYIIPVDCPKTDYYVNAISMGKISEATYEIKAKHILYLMDCCYSGVALIAPRADNDFIIQMTQDPCVYMITAGKAGEQALEMSGHGLFTRYVIRGLDGEADGDKNGVVSGSELGQYTRRWVMHEAHKRNRIQTPRFGTIDGEGEVVFLTPSKASLIVEVSPQGYVSLDGGEKTPAPLDMSGISAGGHTITVSAPDFQPRTIDVMINSGEEKRVPVTLDRAKVKLSIDSTPTGAEVTLNGEMRGKTPLQLDSITTGDHQLSMSLPGYDTVQRSVAIHSPAQPISVSLVRTQVQHINAPLSAQTQLNVTSDPPGSMVNLGALGVHQTPALLKGVKTGNYEASAKLKGYRKASQSFSIRPNMRNTLEFRLLPISRTRMALYSLVVPGSGQFYGGRYGSGTAFLIAGLGAAIGVAVGHIQYNQSVDSYDDSVTQYDSALSLADIEAAKKAMLDAHDDADSKFSLRRGMVVAVGAVWAINAAHAYIMGPDIESPATWEQASLPEWKIFPRFTPGTAAVMVLQKF